MSGGEIRFVATERWGAVSARLVRPEDARWILAFAHGAGAGIDHPFMSQVADELAAHGIASLRYNFPYMERGRRSPDPPAILLETVRAAVAHTAEVGGGLPLLAGGKSMGGRMTSTAASQEPLAGVRGLVFFGFPLHAPGRPSTDRGAHLQEVSIPMLFLQGTRDRFAELELLEPVCRELPGATLKVVEGGDHSFNVPKKSGRSPDEVREALAATVREWAESLA